jgi:hypothetical protein
MAQQENVKPVPLLVIAVLIYVIYTEPVNHVLITVGISLAGWIFFNSCYFPIGVLTVFYLLKLYNMALDKDTPVFKNKMKGSINSGYPKDALSVSQRVENIKGKAPLAPKIASPTGVLESPDILSSAPLLPMDTLAAEGLPGATIPASAKARVIINPPPEDSMPRDNNPNRALMENPYLQNGPDSEGVGTALVKAGTDLSADNGGDAIPSLLTGSGSAF